MTALLGITALIGWTIAGAGLWLAAQHAAEVRRLYSYIDLQLKKEHEDEKAAC